MINVWRDSSPPAFTAGTPEGSHAAWFFTTAGAIEATHGPYFTRRDAEEAAKSLAAALLKARTSPRA